MTRGAALLLLRLGLIWPAEPHIIEFTARSITCLSDCERHSSVVSEDLNLLQVRAVSVVLSGNRNNAENVLNGMNASSSIMDFRSESRTSDVVTVEAPKYTSMWCDVAPIWVALGSGCWSFPAAQWDSLENLAEVLNNQLKDLPLEQIETGVGTVHTKGGPANVSWWALVFTATLFMLLLAFSCLEGRKQVPWPAFESEEELRSVRGRAIWSYFCILLTFGLAIFMFVLTVVIARVENMRILGTGDSQPFLHPHMRELGSNTTVYQPIGDIGPRAFEAGQAVAWSALVGGVTVLAWRSARSVQVTKSLLAQVALRGATLAPVFSTILELGAGAVLRFVGFPETPAGVLIYTLTTMFIVGIGEEACKLCAVLSGTCLQAPAVWSPRTICFSPACCRVLIESRLAMMLAGMSAGFGFMIVENAGYVMAMATTPPMVTKGAGQESNLDNTAITVLTLMTLVTRVFFNLHPWLTAYSAANYAEVAFSKGWLHADVYPVTYFFRAVATPSLIHFAFDTMLLLLPVWGVCFVPIVWWFARWTAMWTWDAIPDPPPTDSTH
eukprot:CAMPEP_0178442980 /NCGR_PEP_ID=MMETSP0689_2-20121128/38546_1 /TAXON_ID=160604 /ORGANISM="Amphidinium massartii, Strain CS-259" /LENGTH=553 /DNA_ID=CAMNT_0020066747 /DNA_START=100 /DNA_END=1758 /DNA_ORIENTATION=+